MDKILVIVGPTAVGKTKTSIALAKLLNGEIINGDAMQVYKGLDIITAKIKKEEMQDVPHHLFSFLDVKDNYSVADYQKNLRNKINEVILKGKTPIIVGGTGLYIKAALYDYEFENQEDDSHHLIEQKYQSYTNEMLYEHLLTIDPQSAKILHKNNRRRVLRAIEIYEFSGKTKSDSLNKQEHKPIYDCRFIGLTLDKDLLNKRIDERVEEMFLENVIDEIKNNPTTSTASKAIGYPQIVQYLNNEISLQECKDLIKQKTRQYRKRQMTWLKHQFDVKWFDVSITSPLEIYNYFKGE